MNSSNLKITEDAFKLIAGDSDSEEAQVIIENYEGEAIFLKKSIRVLYANYKRRSAPTESFTSSITDLGQVMKDFNSKLNWLETNYEACQKAISKKLLKLKNSDWLDEDEAPLSTTDFIAQLGSIQSVYFEPEEDSIIVYMDDNDLFFGHLISFIVDNKSNIKYITFEG